MSSAAQDTSTNISHSIVNDITRDQTMVNIQITNPSSSTFGPPRLDPTTPASNYVQLLQGDLYNNPAPILFKNSTLAEISHKEQAGGISDLYARILLTKRIGYPLWVPEPSTYPVEYPREGVSIGDVGVITFDGHFDFIFNICLPSDHPINLLAPPFFEPVGFNRNRDTRTIPNIHSQGYALSSQNIQRELFDAGPGSQRDG
jgi:hypothetical protein